MSDIKQVFSDIYRNWGFGGNESRSGPGSSLDETQEIRQKIRKLVDDFQIKTVVDLPCGDFNWMKEIVYGFDHYIGGDIVPEIIEANKKYSNSIIEFREFDLTGDVEIPQADLLIVRDVIGHLSLEKGKKVIENILKSKCKYLLSTTWYNVNNPEYYKTHTGNREVDTGRFYPVCLSSEPFNLPLPDFYIEEKPFVDDYHNGNRKGLGFWDLNKIRANFNKDITVVTGLWDIGREGRDFSHYIEHFKKFLDFPVNMFLYLPRELEYLVWQNPNRNKSNTHVRIFELNDIKNNLYSPFWERTQKIRTNQNWLNTTGEGGWLKTSPQAKNEWYNPIVQSKMFMLHDAKVLNVFNTNYFLWIDAGITSTVYEKYFTDNRCLDKIIPYLETFLFLSYPYEARDEIHGFDFNEMNGMVGSSFNIYIDDGDQRKTSVAYKTNNLRKIKYVCRGGLFGGHKDFISQANSTYYSLLDSSLSKNLMGTEESIFSMMAHAEPHIYKRYSLDGNGLIVKFTQALIDDSVILETVSTSNTLMPKGVYVPDKNKTSMYVLSFNFPKQFETLLRSFEEHPEWLDRPNKYLIDNSVDNNTFDEYQTLCKKYGFEHIKTGENLGINRGRHYAAKHFHESNSKYYYFFEDDMCLYPKDGNTFCRNGFKNYIPNLFDISHEIVEREKLDFLKLSYTEVYMDNNVQVSWYNVPQNIRTEFWPDYDQLPSSGLDPYSPRTKFERLEVHRGVSYAVGDVYYANWPLLITKEGNYKMFLETEWEHPFEQTWMSHIFQKTVAGSINAAVLLASPINHNRISHYSHEERREN